MYRGLYIAVLCTAAALLSNGAIAQIRGMDPAQAEFYAGKGGVFTCLDGSKEIPFARVNDDYCDCPDGSDEPGTSACYNGKFYCKNRGHESKVLSASFVDDGICDCCDGSDELNRHCPNTCLEKHAVMRQSLRQAVSMYEQALNKKSEYVAKGAAKRHEITSRLANIDSEIEAHAVEMESLKAEEARLKAEEEDRAAEEAATKQQAADKEAAEAAMKQEAADREAAEAAEAEAAAKAWQEQQEQEQQADTEHYEHGGEHEETDEERGRRIASQWTQDPEAAEVQPEDEVHDFHEHYEEDHYVPKEEELLPPPVSGTPTSTALHLASNAVRNAQHKHTKLVQERSKLQRYMTYDFGPEDMFLALYGRCIDEVGSRWTYGVCPFEEGYQKEGYSNKVVIGRWQGFENNYSTMVFTNGDVCHSVGPRTFRVDLVCGAEEELSDGSEPETCQYHAVLKTPIVCEEGHVEQSKRALHEHVEVERAIRSELGLPWHDEL